MSITENAIAEMKRAGVDEQTKRDVLSIMHMFFARWDSGGAVSVMLPMIVRCLRGQPLSPLTGADDEWIDRSEYSDIPTQQNMRCSSVFRSRMDATQEWRVYDIDLPDDANTVVFPYDPATRVDVQTTFEVIVKE